MTRVGAEDSNVAYITFFDSISDITVKAAMAAICELIDREKPDILYFLFSSPGGDVYPGITLFNFLRALPVNVIMHNIGNIDSIANIVFLAADTRYACVHSSFLLHGIIWNVVQPSLTKGQLCEIIDGINQYELRISGIITERSNLTAEEMKMWFAQGETKTADFALSRGIVCEIKDPMIPKGAKVLTL